MIAEYKRTTEIKHPVIYSDDVVTVYAEQQSFGIQLHAYIHKWTHKTALHVWDVWCAVVANTTEPLFAIADNPKLKKFCEKLGMVSVDTLYDTNDKEIGDLMQFIGVPLEE